MAELVVRGGTLLDGTGAPGRRGDVAISGGRIVGIGDGLHGDVELDAGGQVVSPGFIDIHTHYDAQVFWDPDLTPSCYHGVTTVVAGNCGFSVAPIRADHHDLLARTLENVEDMNAASLAAGIPWDFGTFPEYLASVGRRGTLLNFGAFIGHTAVRLYVMGTDAYRRAATAEEVAAMVAVLREALDAGAAGFATSFSGNHRGADGLPVPSRFAEPEEVTALFAALAAAGVGVLEVSPGEQCSIADLYRRQAEIGVPCTYGALVSYPSGEHEELLALHRRGREEGARVWPQVTPRPLVVEMSLAEPAPFALNLVFAALLGRTAEQRRAAYADRSWRAEAETGFARQERLRPRWETFEITSAPRHPHLEGRRVTDVAAERGVAPLDAILDAALEEADLGLRVRFVVGNDDEAAVARLLREEQCAIGLSDAGAHVGQLCDAPQATDLLGPWVRDRGLMPLEAAVRRLTGAQADLFAFADRGYLREGAWADVVVFDPATIGPGPIRRVRDFPAGVERLTADAPSGVTHVLVNGTPIRVDGRPVEPDGSGRPGRLVRPGRTAPAGPGSALQAQR